MRIVEIRLEDDHGGIVELHPQITVLAGLTADARARLLESVRSVSAGAVPPVGTVMAVHDLLVEATSSVLAVLDLAPGADPVVEGANGSPSAPPDGGEGAAVDAEINRRVGDARRRYQEAKQQVARAEGGGGPDDGLARLEEARAAHQLALQRVEEAERARSQLAPRARPPVFDPHPWDARLEGLRRRANELDAVLAELPTVDPEPLRRALADHEAASPPPVVTSDEDPPAVVEARAELDDARRALAEWEERARPLQLDPGDVAELEAAHAELEEAEERAQRALSGPLTRRKVSQAKQRLDTVLDRLGLPSYGAFLLRSSVVNVDEEARHALQVARYRVQAAQAELAEAEEQAIRDRARAELAAEQEQRLRADEHRAAATRRLIDTLAEVGGPVDEGDPAGAARRFLDHLEDSHRRRADLVAEKAGVDDTIGEVQRERAQAERSATEASRAGESRAAEERARAEQELERARAESERAAVRLEELASELTEHDDARPKERSGEVDDAHQRLEAARRELQEAESLERARREQLAHASRDPRSESPGEDDLEVRLLSRLAALRTAGRAGSLPLVLDRVFDHVASEKRPPALRLLERMAPSVQVVVISDDEELAHWAAGLGIERAVVVGPGAAHAPAAAET